MPVMDGLESSRQLTRRMPDIPLMMFTSHVDKVMEEDARKAGYAGSSQKANHSRD
jgi:CheY-like chemotaxis protein